MLTIIFIEQSRNPRLLCMCLLPGSPKLLSSPNAYAPLQDSDTNPNTTASSVVGDTMQPDGRKRRSEATQLRKSVFGKKHNRLDESKVGHLLLNDVLFQDLY